MGDSASIARRELLQRLELPRSSGLARSSDRPVLRTVAGIRLFAEELPDLEAGLQTEPAVLANVLGLLRSSHATHLDDLLDEARDDAAVPAGHATEAVLARALQDLYELELVDWHADSEEVADDLDEDDDDGPAPVIVDDDDDELDAGGVDEDEQDDEDDGDDDDDADEHGQQDEYVQFVDLDPDDQVYWVWRGLLGEGALPRDEFIRAAAEHLRSEGLASFKRLHGSGKLYKAIEATLKRGFRAGRFDKPARGERRAVITKREMRELPKKRRRRMWRDRLLEVLQEQGPLQRDEAIRATVEWGAEVYGFRLERFRADGIYARWVRSAINGAIRRGQVQKLEGRRLGIASESGAAGNTAEPGNSGAPAGNTVEPGADQPNGTEMAGLGDLLVHLEPLDIPTSFEALVLQFRVPEEDKDGVVDLIRRTLVREWRDHAPPPGQRWMALVSRDVPHYMGHSLWIGLSRNVPLDVVGGLQTAFEGAGVSVQREMAQAARHGLMPFLARDERAIVVFVEDELSLPLDALCEVGRGVDVRLLPWRYV